MRGLRRPHILGAALTAVTLSLGVPALAASGDAATAEVLFREGRKLSDEGKVDAACAKFRESARLDPAVGTTFNIADCEERLGHLAEAWSSFQEVMQLLPATDKRRQIAAERASALEKRLPRLRIRLAPSSGAGTRVSRDGVELGTPSLGVDLPVNPGTHVIVVKAQGRVERSYEVSLTEAQSLTVDVEPGAPEESSGSAAPLDVTASTSGGGDRTLGYVLGGIGVAGVVTGAIAGVLTLQKKSTVDDNCNADKRCNQEGLDAADAGKTLSVVSTIGFITGAVGLGAGAYFLITAAPSRDGGVNAAATLTGRF